MAKAAAVIHKTLYVTVQFRSDSKAEDGLLGFASPYTNDSAFEKRKITQDSWAYGPIAKVTIDPESQDITVDAPGGYRGGNGAGEKWDATMLFIANCHPRLVDNRPVEGFQLSKSVRRRGWGGSGNVKWRIADPRGFELEISSENLANILGCTTVVNGIIKEKCCWGRSGAENILLPVTATLYQEAIVQTSRVGTKVSLKDVQLGDWEEK